MTDGFHRIVVQRASDISPRRPLWHHYPHCHNCHRRLHGEADDSTVTAPTQGGSCPHCGAQLIYADDQPT